MLSKSLIQFSVDGCACVPSLLFDLRPNHGGGNEDNGDLLPKVLFKHCCTQCPRLCSRPPLTHVSARDSWTFMSKSGSVSCGVTIPFSWILVCTRFCFALLASVSQSCVSSRGSVVGLMVTSPNRAYAIPKSAVPRASSPAAVHCCPVPLQETLKHFLLSLCGVSGSWCTQGLFEPS